jgi:arylsulfatase
MGKPPELGFSKSFSGGGSGGSDDWVQILKNRPKDRPFFMWFASHDAHRGWELDSTSPHYDANSLTVPPYLINGPQTRKELADYYHEVSRTDAQVGLLIQELERQQITGDTYFIYCSDNGRPFPRCKTRLYDSGVRTPLIISRPGHVPAARTRSLVSSIDLAPTFLELAGAPPMASAQGVSLVPVLRDPDVDVRHYAFSEHNWHVFAAHERSVRFGKWLFIRNAWPSRRAMCVESSDAYPAGKELWNAHAKGKTTVDQNDVFLNPRPAEEFYECESDPHQLRNLISSEAHAAEIREARGLLDRWARETGDTVPKNPTPDREGELRRRQERGELPGEASGADSLIAKGPVRR